MFFAGVCKAIMDLTEEGVIKPSKQDTWRNKYKNGDPAQGAKFFLSTSWLVFLTDGWHFFSFLRRLCTVLAIIFYLPWFGYLYDFLMLYGALLVGFKIIHYPAKNL
jgi:hypothetical protein